MRIILLGAPGAGKGTQADFICHRLNIPRISTGDMLRAHIANNTSIGQTVRLLMAKGALVPEDIVIEMLKERIHAPDCASGFLLDGFPRTIHQAEVLDKMGITIDAVIEIYVPDEEIVKRLTGRRVHVASGRSYHVSLNPPKIHNTDDITGEPLIQRDDDKEEAIRKRLDVYQEQTRPMIQWFQARPEKYNFISIQGTGSIDEIRHLLESVIGSSTRGAQMPVLKLTKDNFDTIIYQHPMVLVDFWAEWCGPCHVFSEIYHQAATLYPEIVFGQVNIEEEPELAQDFNVQAIPLLMIFRGNIALYRESGALTLTALKEVIKSAKEADLSDVQRSIQEQNSQ